MTRAIALGSAFTPAAPVDDQSLFAGRVDQLMTCSMAMGQHGVHIGVYGERGVGKTSLANILPKVVNEAARITNVSNQVLAVRVDCATNDDFTSLWRKVFRELERGAVPTEDAFDPEGVRFRLQNADVMYLIVLDEFDRLEDDETISLLADTLKTLSDHRVWTTVMIVGVAASVDLLVGEHESVARSLVQVPMPRMSVDEMNDVLARGLSQAQLEIEPEARRVIVSMAEGLPHFVHLLGLHSGQHAIAEERTTIVASDVQKAIRMATRTHSMMSAYDVATRSNQSANLYQQVLLACAFAKKDHDGTFRTADVRPPLARIMGKTVGLQTFARHLEEFCSDARGNSLQRSGEERRYRYRFKDPLLQPFVKMATLEKGVVSEEAFRQLEQEFPPASWVMERAWPTDLPQLLEQ